VAGGAEGRPIPLGHEVGMDVETGHIRTVADICCNR
jgi:hypothetical protein